MNFSNLNYLLLINSVLFLIGVFGVVFNKKSIIIIIMSLEIVLLSVNLNFIYFSLYLDDCVGHIFVLFILAVAAIESAVGLAIITINYKLKATTKQNFYKNIKG